MSKDNDIPLSEYLCSITESGTSKPEEVDTLLTNMFGYRPTKKDWAFADNKDGINFAIRDISTSGKMLDISFLITEGKTTEVSRKCQISIYKNDDGGINLHLSSLHKDPSYKGKIKVGETFTKYAHKTLNEIAKKTGKVNKLTLHAESNDRGYTGGYNWASHAYSFSNPNELNSMRGSFKGSLGVRGINLSDDDMKSFTHPCHFAAFDYGEKSVIDTHKTMPLTEQQIKTQSISCQNGKDTLTPYELKYGNTDRTMVPYGKSRLLDMDWWGEWKTGDENTEEKRYFKAMTSALDKGKSREQAYKIAFMTLSPEYKKVVQKAKEQYQEKTNPNAIKLFMSAARKTR